MCSDLQFVEFLECVMLLNSCIAYGNGSLELCIAHVLDPFISTFLKEVDPLN